MTTDNKTLADAQPGGRVRIPDQTERARFEAWANANPGATAWDGWQAALSAHPSPGGQDALLESLVARWRNHAEEIGISDNLLCQKIANCTMRHAAELQAVLAARQPVGEPVGWYTEDHLTDRSATTYDRTVADRWRAKGWPVSPLYAAPPAQAVDLGPMRDVFRRWHANELNSTDAMLALVEALAVIDSQAVGNG
ncbi:hypothetical protein [Stenotrophomonas geniculata]|uniref:hypothetical protein n=1 Tax=Stenotrophomonas geniculata TaxID=86188 RepID=UPI00247973A5|nr:hypothetical protein [Stenotrophomonas geniculata]MDH7550196.1 hypothetical protein [Stenotrophomonas geniculata]